jgi:hypothetical protein
VPFDYQKLGAKTTYLGLTCFALLVLFFSSLSAGSAPLAEISFSFRAGLIWIQVDNPRGGKPLNFILDSGAEASVIDLQTARRLRLELGQPITVRGINATTLGYWPEHLSAQMGGVALPTNYLAMDLSEVSAACHHKADGLIGADFFSGRIVQIDFAKEKIRLLENFKPGVNAEVLPLQIEGSRMRAPVEVVGLGKAWARLDTGCASALHWTVGRRGIVPGTRGRRQQHFNPAKQQIRAPWPPHSQRHLDWTAHRKTPGGRRWSNGDWIAVALCHCHH